VTAEGAPFAAFRPVGPRTNSLGLVEALWLRTVSKQTTFIAIVDDEESIRRALLRLMRSAGLAAECFSSGAEFLNSLAIREPRCVVLDLHMPGMSGFEVQALLAHSWPDLPVIVVTGHHTAETRAQALSTHPLAYLLKPIDDRLLLDAIGLAGK
jgi:FixJ family two-component response regulator